MKVIKNLKIGYYMNGLLTNLKEIDDANNEEQLRDLLIQNNDLLTSFKKFLQKNPDLKNSLRYEDSEQFYSYSFLKNRVEFISFFQEKDFDSAFHLTYSLIHTTHQANQKANYTLSAIEALTQIKIEYLTQDKWIEYKQKYQFVEDSLFELAKPLMKEKLVSPYGCIQQNIFNPLKIELAQLAFLDNNQSLAKELIQEQIKISGGATVLYQDMNPPVWFSSSINQSYRDEFNQFVTQIETPKKITRKP